jgi:hypothetical protein
MESSRTRLLVTTISELDFSIGRSGCELPEEEQEEDGTETSDFNMNDERQVIEQRGLWFEEFELDVIYRHRPGRTVTEAGRSCSVQEPFEQANSPQQKLRLCQTSVVGRPFTGRSTSVTRGRSFV